MGNGDGAEDFVGGDGKRWVHLVEQRRGHIVAGVQTGRAAAAEAESRAVALALRDVARDLLVLLARGEGADHRVGLGWTDGQPCGFFGQRLDEPTMHRPVQQVDRRRGTDLPGIAEACVHCVGGGAVDVGVVEHDHRVLAAQFQHHRLDPLGRGPVDSPPGGNRSGESDTAHQRMAH